jgi:hypothetical protein
MSAGMRVFTLVRCAASSYDTQLHHAAARSGDVLKPRSFAGFFVPLAGPQRGAQAAVAD